MNEIQADVDTSVQPMLLLEHQPRFDMDLVQRLLGKRRRRNLTRTTRKRLERYRKPVLDCLSPRVIWQTFKIASCTESGVRLENGVFFHSRKMAGSFCHAEKLVCFVATVGRDIDRMIETLVDKGSVADAYVIDAMGSGAIEHTASSFQSDYVDKASQDYSATLRFSPGYCDWHISEQNKLFSLLDCEDIGVTLSDTALMTPRKSVSAVFGLHDKSSVPGVRPQNPCQQCGKRNCIARRSPESDSLQ